MTLELENILFHHYTSVSGFLNIVRSGRFRASSISALNDPRELHLGTQIVEKFLNDLSFLPGSAEQQHLELFREQYFMIAPTFEPFATSFSAAAESLPQWIEYGDRGRGVCLSFSKFPLEEDDSEEDGAVTSSEVVYSEEDFREQLEAIFRDSQWRYGQDAELDHAASVRRAATDNEFDEVPATDSRVWNDVLEIRSQCAAFKHPSWAHEEEIRGTIFVWKFGQGHDASLVIPDGDTEAAIPNGIEFRETNGRIVPFVEITIPRSEVVPNGDRYVSCSRITLGSQSLLTPETVGILLKKYNWHSSDVQRSDCHLR